MAHALAKAIPCPAVCRDEIKEGLVHAHGPGFEAGPGDPLTQRAFPLFFDVVRALVAGGATVVAEATFQDRLWRRGLEPLRGLAELRIVQCHVEAALGRDRALARKAAEPGHDRAHGRIIGADLDEWTRAYASFERLSLDAPSLDVDTTDGYAPALTEIVAFVDAHHVP